MKYHTCMLLATSLLWLVTTPGIAAGQNRIGPGDRIAIVGNTFADQLRLHGYLETMLLQRWPEQPVAIRNLGWAGDMLAARDRPTGFASEEASLREHHTDVIIACFGMGESFAGEAGLAQFKSDLQSFLATHAGKSYNGHSPVRLIVVSPIAYEDLGQLTPAWKQRNAHLQLYTQVIREVAAAADAGFINLYEPSRYLMQETRGPDLTTNGIHLDAYGYWALSHEMYRQLTGEPVGSGSRPWRVELNTEQLTVTAQGVRVSEVEHRDRVWEFTVEELTGAGLAPPTSRELPVQLQYERDQLRIVMLPVGDYQLTIDDQLVATADAAAWSEGVAIDGSPAHMAAEALRQAVNDKNLQFIYSWRALNQVHIVGERRSSPSGRALPAELAQFAQAAADRESALRQMLTRHTRRWRLQPATP